jgi:hypothetical protein
MPDVKVDMSSVIESTESVPCRLASQDRSDVRFWVVVTG